MATLFSPSRLILGTVQLGMPYGIANSTGQPNQEDANAIIKEACCGGIVFFDTAQAYGNSEEVLGNALATSAQSSPKNIITKLSPKLPTTIAAIDASLQESLVRLGVQSFYCVMLHREDQLQTLDGYVGEALIKAKEDGIIRAIGISVYTPEKALEALEHPLVSVVQIPANIFDRRFEQAGVFALASKLGKEVHTRSVFLQGALLMPSGNIPDCLAELYPYLLRLENLSEKYETPLACIVLGWVLQFYEQAKIIFGVETQTQVLENILYLNQLNDVSPLLWAECNELIPPQKNSLFNPGLWP